MISLKKYRDYGIKEMRDAYCEDISEDFVVNDESDIISGRWQ